MWLSCLQMGVSCHHWAPLHCHHFHFLLGICRYQHHWAPLHCHHFHLLLGICRYLLAYMHSWELNRDNSASSWLHKVWNYILITFWIPNFHHPADPLFQLGPGLGQIPLNHGIGSFSNSMTLPQFSTQGFYKCFHNHPFLNVSYF